MTRPAGIAVQPLFLCLYSLAVAACGGSELTLPSGGTAADISIVRGNNQAAPPGTLLRDSIIVEVVDSAGTPLSGQRVEFAPEAPGSAVAPNTVVTDAIGRAGARWVLGTTTGRQELIARVTSGAASSGLQVSFTAMAQEGLPSAPVVSVERQPSGSATVGEPFDRQPVVQIRDAAGNALATSGVAVTAAIVSGSGTLAGATTRLTDPNGRAEFSDLRIEGATGPHLLIFAASGYTSVISEPVNVVPGTGQKSATTTHITAHDPNPSARGQAVQVSFSVTSDGGTPGGTVTVTAGGGGESCTGAAPAGSCSLTLNHDGDRTLTVSYSGNDSFAGSSAQVSHRVKGGGGGGGGGGSDQPPTAISDSYDTVEGGDHTLTVSAAGGVLQNDRDPENGQLTASLVNGPDHGRVTLEPDGSFSYTPVPEYYGSDHFSYRATDPAGSSSTAVVTIQVAPVNDSPRFADRGNPPSVGPNAGPQVVKGWARDINPGKDESDQTVVFLITSNSNPGLFTSGGQPAVSSSGPGSPGGDLTYTPSGTTGTATISVTPRDNGGTANGGADTGRSHTFTITVR